jgi:hypothetical protein
MTMAGLRTYHKYGECKRGLHNKYYEVEAIELEDGTATWSFRWARIGQICGKPKEGTAAFFEMAKRICITQWKKKQKDYKEVTAMEALASAAQELDERPNNGLPAVDIPTPRFQAGKSEKRLRSFCEKYVKKLNVIRASKNALSSDAYEKQVRKTFDQCCAEFARIKRSKSHGPNCKGFTDTAFRGFLEALKDNAGCVVYGYYYSYSR